MLGSLLEGVAFIILRKRLIKKEKAMKTPNYEKQKGKHPIPHAKGIAQDDNLQPKSIELGEAAKNSSEKEK